MYKITLNTSIISDEIEHLVFSVLIGNGCFLTQLLHHPWMLQQEIFVEHEAEYTFRPRSSQLYYGKNLHLILPIIPILKVGKGKNIVIKVINEVEILMSIEGGEFYKIGLSKPAKPNLIERLLKHNITVIQEIYYATEEVT